MDPPEPMELDIDGNETEGSTHSIRDSNARRKTQTTYKSSFSWLLSQDSSTDREMEYGDSY